MGHLLVYMNKYQDLHIKHLKAQSFSSLPSIRFVVKKTHMKELNLKDSNEDFVLNSDKFTSASVQNTDRKGKNKSISEFSEQQNAKLYSYLTPMGSEVGKNSFFPEIKLKTAFTERDYTDLMNSINEVISPKRLSKSIMISEGENYEVSLEPGKLKHFRCFVKGKKTPLVIKIKKKSGKVCVFTSSETQEPGPLNYEKCYYSDYIEVRDSSSSFKYESLNFGIKALQKSEFKVSVSFGEKFSSLNEFKRIKRELAIQPKIEFTEEDDEAKVEQSQPKLSNKDFIAENKLSQFSSRRASIINNRAQNWKLKREKVLSKKKICLESKKSKTLEKLNRHKVKAEIEKARIEVVRKKNLRDNVHGSWLTFIYFAKSIEAFHLMLRERRLGIQRKKMMIKKVKVIQKAFRAFKGKLSVKDLTLIRSKNCLLHYFKSCRFAHYNEIGQNLTNYVFYSANAQRVFNKFSTFFRSLVKIQRMIRRHLSRKEQVINELRRSWNFACEHFLFKKGSNKKKARKKTSLKIISIPNNIRDATLEKYYMKCVEFYKRDTKKMLENVGNDEQKKVFHTALNGMIHKKVMFYDYLPTKRQMEKIIDETLKQIDEKNENF